MTNTDVFALRYSDLNEFLFAEVGVETNGTTLSVLSALGRLGIDPWQEARRLAQLPWPAAVDGLARIIVSISASPWSLSDATAIAKRLVALLPRDSEAPMQTAPAWTASVIGKRWLVVFTLLGGLLVGFVLDRTGQLGEASEDGIAGWTAGQQNSTGVPPPGSRSPTN